MLRYFSKFNLPSINSITAILEINRVNIKVCERNAVKIEKTTRIRLFPDHLEKRKPAAREISTKQKKTVFTILKNSIIKTTERSFAF